MNRNKKTKNVKQNKAIDNITDMTNDINGTQTNFHNVSNSKSK